MTTFKKTIVATILSLVCITAGAHEGMWIPSTLAKLVVDDMQDAGLKLSAEEIYSINRSSIKDAIVHFGGGCTAEVISEQGLILTNHHCGYGQIQAHSSLQNDYLKNGFWAMSHEEELPNPGLTATFVKRIEDVTAQVLAAGEGLEGNALEAAIAEEIAKLEKNAVEGTGYEAKVKPFYYGNAYYMIVTETFSDVRLVGAPPSSIGKFGGDTDNWMWPRHTGDFSVFRIYASAENAPAEFSDANVPYKPAYSLPINMDGVRTGDYTMVFGFPGYTQQYLTSFAVEHLVAVENPARIEMREAALEVIDVAMAASDEIRIQYAAKQSRISNAWKKWIGQNMGLERYNAVEKKKAMEAQFAAASKQSPGHAGNTRLLEEFQQLYSEENLQYPMARTYLIEYFYYGPEILRFAAGFANLVDNYNSLDSAGTLEAEMDRLKRAMSGYFKDYNATVDRGVFAAQTPIFFKKAPQILQSPILAGYARKYAKNPDEMAEAIYAKSIFDDREGLERLMAGGSKKLRKSLASDPFYQIAQELLNNYKHNVLPGYTAFSDRENQLMQTYVKATMELFPEENYWPDANSTMRITYGKMERSEPRDGIIYKAYTTLGGAVQKYIPGDTEFDLPEKLITLYNNRDFGPYATDGEMRVCFIGSNHTTGGNSGSPALDANGRLVGINFDRTWESTMSDVMFNGEICRNIMVDIKYVLFIIDKYAGAEHLIREMNLVYGEKEQPVLEEFENQPAGKASSPLKHTGS